MRNIVVISLIVTLAGCGTTKIDVRNDYRASVAAYKECLATDPPKDCERLRLMMEAEEHQYNAVAADTAGGNSTANINAPNRFRPPDVPPSAFGRES
jgi:hypothetical protein